MIKHIAWCFLFVLMVFTACNKNKKEQLSKLWKVTSVDFIKNDTTKVAADSLALGSEDIMEEVMESMFTNVSYHFHSNESCDIEYNGKPSKGHWELLNGGKELLIENYSSVQKEGSEKPKPSIIEHLDDTSLVLLMKSDQSSYDIRLGLSASPAK